MITSKSIEYRQSRPLNHRSHMSLWSGMGKRATETPGGGGYSQFFLIRRLGPSIYCLLPKKIRNTRQPKKIFQFCTLTLRKGPKMCINNPPNWSSLVMTPKISTIPSYPKKYSFFFQKPPKNIEIQNFEPPKMVRAYVEYSPPPKKKKTKQKKKTWANTSALSGPRGRGGEVL